MKRILLVTVLVICVLMMLGRRFVISFFITDELTLSIGIRQLNLILLFLPTYYLTLLFRAVLGGMGRGVASMVSGLIEASIRVAAVIILLPLMGEWGLYIFEVIGWPFMMAQLMFVYYSVAGLRFNLRNPRKSPADRQLEDTINIK